MTWFQLPSLITKMTGQKRVPFGDGAILEIANEYTSEFDFSSSSSMVRIGYEICEELWQPDTQSARLLGLRGCHLVMNVSGSYWELRKLDSAISHARSATGKSGGVYAYVNNLGCDGGGRLCCYGRSFVVENGNLLTMTTHSRETLFDEIEVSVAWIDPSTIQQYRQQKNICTRTFKVEGNSIKFNANQIPYEDSSTDAIISKVTTINIEGFNVLRYVLALLCDKAKFTFLFRKSTQVSTPIQLDLKLTPEEEIMRYCCLWLWDYLRRCIPGGIRGFIVPLSGGLDSCSVACIIYCLSVQLHYQIYKRANQVVAQQLKPVFDADANKQATPADICNKLLRCCYLQTQFSGSDSLDRAEKLAKLIGAQFVSYNFSHLYKAIVTDAPCGVKPPQPDEVTLQQQNVQVSLE